MDNTITFNENFTQVVFKGFDGVEQSFSIEALEQFKNISGSELEELQRFHYLSTLGARDGLPVPPIVTPLSELVGVDLTGKLVQVYESNWEDSQWMQSENVTTVEKDPTDESRYFFVPVTDESDDENEDWDGFFASSFSGCTEATIVDITKQEDTI